MRLILCSLRAATILAMLTCGIYPLVVTGLSAWCFPYQSRGSLITNNGGQVIGSALIGQQFAADHYFQPRPSAAGAGYDASNSGGSNLGPNSHRLQEAVRDRLATFRKRNALPDHVSIPADAVTASGSGLDPHISPRNASLQAVRVAKARNLSVERVLSIIEANTERPVLGPDAVNVLKLNLALDAL